SRRCTATTTSPTRPSTRATSTASSSGAARSSSSAPTDGRADDRTPDGAARPPRPVRLGAGGAMGRLDNRIALVTGSARGLGEGIARALGREGAVVVCADVLDAAPVAGSLPAAPDGRRSRAVHLDVTDTKRVEETV